MESENKIAYESPELIEIGDARELTLGQIAKKVPDACDCAKDC